jgi:hypothetical protein
MAHFPVIPIRLIHGSKVKDFRVLELKSVLLSFRVPEFDHAQNKADKLVQHLNAMSKSRASQGSRGALENGRLIEVLSAVELRSAIAARRGDHNFMGCLQTELQRIVRLRTGHILPLTVQPPLVAQPQQRVLRSNAHQQPASVMNANGLCSPLPLAPSRPRAKLRVKLHHLSRAKSHHLPLRVSNRLS